MSWFFGQSETTLLLDKICSTYKQNKADITIGILEGNILDEENKSKLKTTLEKAVYDFLYYYPKIKEVDANVGNFFSNAEQTQKLNEKLQESANNSYNKLTETKSQRWQVLLDDILNDQEKASALVDVIDKQITSFLTSLGEEGLIQLCNRIEDHNRQLSENHRHKQSMLKLTNRAKEIIANIKDAQSHDWLVVLLNPGILNDEQRNKFISHMSTQAENFLSTFSEIEMRYILDGLTGYKQSVEMSRKKAEEIERMRHRGTVKSNISAIESQFKNPMAKSNRIIKTSPVVVPSAFIIQMGHIHGRKADELKIQVDNRIHVKETYPSGLQRMRGIRVGAKRVGVWKWWTPKGDQFAEYSYDTQKWHFTLEDKTVIRGKGFENGIECSKEEFVQWLNEARE